MSNTKTVKYQLSRSKKIAEDTGIVVMSMAALVGMLELSDHLSGRIIVPVQTSFASSLNQNIEANNPLRREREESDQHYVAYSIVQRTPSRASKR